jgi:hypothetical protein
MKLIWKNLIKGAVRQLFWGVTLVKITYHGSEKEIIKAVEIIKRNRIKKLKETKARLKVQELIDKHKVTAIIMINETAVWSKKRIIDNLEAIIKHGTLYNHEDQSKPPILSRYFYEFLTSQCGSVDHYDIYGWIHRYPTVRRLKCFFKRNEFGKRVIDYIPENRTDNIKIVQAIERKLFPFEKFMESAGS